MNDTYRTLDAKEVAAFLRQDLKAAFPRTKFAVRISRYSMGSSVHVAWTDGPNEAQVKVVTDALNFYRFDGMQDLASTASAAPYRGELVRASCSVEHSRQFTVTANDLIRERLVATVAGAEALVVVARGDGTGYIDTFRLPYGSGLDRAVNIARSDYTEYPGAPTEREVEEEAEEEAIVMSAQELQEVTAAARAAFGGLFPAGMLEAALAETAALVTVIPSEEPVWIDAETVPSGRGVLN